MNQDEVSTTGTRARYAPFRVGRRFSAARDALGRARPLAEPRTFAQALSYLGGRWFVRMFPRSVLLPAFLSLGRMAYRFNTPRTRVLRRTLAQIDSELGAHPAAELV